MWSRDEKQVFSEVSEIICKKNVGVKRYVHFINCLKRLMKKQSDEVLKHLINAKEELINALKSFLEKNAVKTKKTTNKIKLVY
jgi:hypothetical protein